MIAPITSTPCFSKSARLSAISSIGRPMPPRLTMMTLLLSSLATVALERSKTLPTPAWPGALDDDEVLLPRHLVERGAHAVVQLLAEAAGKIAAGEVGLDRDGAHRADGRVRAVGVVDQHGVLVDLRALHVHEPLAHRLDVADARKALAAARRRGRPTSSSCRRPWRVAATKMRGVIGVAHVQFGPVRRPLRFFEDGVGHVAEEANGKPAIRSRLNIGMQ